MANIPPSLLQHPKVLPALNRYLLIRQEEGMATALSDVLYFRGRLHAVLVSTIKASRVEFRHHHGFAKWDQDWEALWEIATGFRDMDIFSCHSAIDEL